jgi:hypothetical protein
MQIEIPYQEFRGFLLYLIGQVINKVSQLFQMNPSQQAFWSVTMFGLTESLLVANPVNRYLLN